MINRYTMDNYFSEGYDTSDYVYNDYNDYNYTSSDIGISDELGYMLIFLVICGSWLPCFKLMNTCKNNRRKSMQKKKHLRIKTIAPNDADNLLNECPICLDKYENNDKICILKCDHVFHEKCIKEWLKNNESCPNCRGNIL